VSGFRRTRRFGRSIGTAGTLPPSTVGVDPGHAELLEEAKVFCEAGSIHEEG
jgi:hypothetical protein